MSTSIFHTSSRRTKLADAETPPTKSVRCAIYTRKSTEEGLDQDFNSLDAQREAGENFIRSQACSRAMICDIRARVTWPRRASSA